MDTFGHEQDLIPHASNFKQMLNTIAIESDSI